MTNPAVDAINAIKVPKGWKASEQLIDLFRQRAAAGTQIEAEDLDTLIRLLVGSQIEVINAFGVQDAQRAELRQSWQGLADLFKRPDKSE